MKPFTITLWESTRIDKPDRAFKIVYQKNPRVGVVKLQWMFKIYFWNRLLIWSNFPIDY